MVKDMQPLKAIGPSIDCSGHKAIEVSNGISSPYFLI